MAGAERKLVGGRHERGRSSRRSSGGQHRRQGATSTLVRDRTSRRRDGALCGRSYGAFPPLARTTRRGQGETACHRRCCPGGRRPMTFWKRAPGTEFGTRSKVAYGLDG